MHKRYNADGNEVNENGYDASYEPQRARSSFWGSQSGGASYIKNLASQIGKQNRVKVEFIQTRYGGYGSAEEQATRTNMETRTVYLNISNLWTKGDDYVIGELLHEVAHVRFSPKPADLDFSKIPKQYHGKAKEVYNMLEDNRINEKMVRSHAGAPYYFSAMYSDVFDKLASTLESDPILSEDEAKIKEAIKEKVELKARSSLFYTREVDEDGDTDGKKQAIKEEQKAQTIELMFKRRALYTILALSGLQDAKIEHSILAPLKWYAIADKVADYSKLAHNVNASTAEMTEYTGKVIDLVKEYIPDEKEEKQAQQMATQIKGELRELLDALSQGTGDGHSHEDQRKQMRTGGSGINAGHGLGEGWKKEQFIPEAYAHTQSLVTKLTSRLKANMRENSRNKFIGNKRKGLLAKRQISRVARNNYRVYRQRIEFKDKNYAISVLVDTSGSMWSFPRHKSGRSEFQNIETALQASTTLIRTFQNLGFNSALRLYGDKSAEIHSFGEKYNVQNWQDKVEKLDGHVWNGGTNMNPALKLAIQGLTKEGAKRGAHRLMVLITDGGLDGDDIEKTRRMLTKEMAKGDFTPAIFYVETHQRILNMPDFERSIVGDSSLLLTEAVSLLKRSILV